jgi:hypothetical protein
MFHPSCSRCTKRGIPCVYNANTSNPLALFMVNIAKDLNVDGGEVNMGSPSLSSVMPTPPVTSRGSTASSTTAMPLGLKSNNRTGFTDSLPKETDLNESLIDQMLNSNQFGGSMPTLPSPDESTNGMSSSNESSSPSNYLSDRCARYDYYRRTSKRPHSSSSSSQFSPEVSSAASTNEPMDLIIPSLGDLLDTVVPLRHFAHCYDFSSKIDTRTETMFCIERCKQYPSLFVRYIYTPFIHPTLYEEEIPKSLGVALSVCALYQELSDKNESAILASINSLSDSLVTQDIPNDIVEVLAFAQAICLTQCVRLFSGDIRTSSLAERAIPKLIFVLDRLAEYVIENGKPDLPWRRWVLIESMGRTLFVGFMSQYAYCSLRGDYFYDIVSDIPVTLSKKLWLARSLSGWQKGKELDPVHLCQPMVTQNLPVLYPEKFLESCASDSIDYEFFVCVALCCGVKKLETVLGRGLREFPEFLDGMSSLSKSRDVAA